MRSLTSLGACLAALVALAALGADVAEAGSAPTVTSLEPSSGSTMGGAHVTIFGDFLEEVRSVHFGMTAGTILEEECDGMCEIFPYTVLLVESPPHAGGTVDVTVTTTQGTSVENTGDRFIYASTGGKGVPSIEGLSASRVTETSAQLKARIDPNGAATHYSFWVKYDPCQHGAGECAKGPQTELVAEGKLPASGRRIAVREALGKLKHGCLYAYWVVAANSRGEMESSQQTVETTGKEGLGCLR